MPEGCDVGLVNAVGTLVACVGPGSNGLYANDFIPRSQLAAEDINSSAQSGRCDVNIFNDLVFLCDHNGSYLARLVYLNEPPSAPSLSNESVRLFNQSFCGYHNPLNQSFCEAHDPGPHVSLPIEIVQTIICVSLLVVVAVLGRWWWKRVNAAEQAAIARNYVAGNVAGVDGGESDGDPPPTESTGLLESSL